MAVCTSSPDRLNFQVEGFGEAIATQVHYAFLLLEQPRRSTARWTADEPRPRGEASGSTAPRSPAVGVWRRRSPDTTRTLW